MMKRRRCNYLASVILTALMVLIWAQVASAQNQAPIANAGEDQSIYLGDAAYLSGTATDPDGDAIVSWDWRLDFKPTGSKATLYDADWPTPYFIPDLAGDYIISLVVSDGTTQSAPDGVVIHVTENLPPTAVITSDLTTGPAPLVVSFDGTDSSDPEGADVTYLWRFADGSSAVTEAMPVHEFQLPGTYVIALDVTDDRGQSDRDTMVIEVTERSNTAPVVAPTATPQTGTAPLPVQFNANASDPDGDALTFAWDFGDGNTSTDANPLHTYSTAGTYVAWITVSDGEFEVTDSVTITVTENIPTYTCIGFGPPLADGSVKVKKNRALPAKGQLSYDGFIIEDIDIISPPVIEVLYSSSIGEDVIDVTEEAYSAGMGTDGNVFEYNPDDLTWHFNLKTKSYTASGTYTINMKSGDETEYMVETCTATFVIK